jgi:hypothetical protein
MVIFFFVFIPILKLLRISGFNDYYSFEDNSVEEVKKINLLIRNFFLESSIDEKILKDKFKLDESFISKFLNFKLASSEFNQVSAIKVIGNQWY